jgi:hypothetical protein
MHYLLVRTSGKHVLSALTMILPHLELSTRLATFQGIYQGNLYNIGNFRFTLSRFDCAQINLIKRVDFNIRIAMRTHHSITKFTNKIIDQEKSQCPPVSSSFLSLTYDLLKDVNNRIPASEADHNAGAIMKETGPCDNLNASTIGHSANSYFIKGLLLIRLIVYDSL